MTDPTKRRCTKHEHKYLKERILAAKQQGIPISEIARVSGASMPMIYGAIRPRGPVPNYGNYERIIGALDKLEDTQPPSVAERAEELYREITRIGTEYAGLQERLETVGRELHTLALTAD